MISKAARLVVPLLLNFLTLKIFLTGSTKRNLNLYSLDSMLQALVTEDDSSHQEVLRVNQTTPPVAVFYNLYTASEMDIPRVSELVREQLAPLQDNKHTFHPLYIKSIGAIRKVEDLQLFKNIIICSYKFFTINYFTNSFKKITI